MTNNRSGATALIAGAGLSILVFAFHPSHVVAEPVLGPFTTSQLVHWTALVAVPLLTLGLWQLGEWLGLDKAAVRLGLVLSFLAAAATVNAAVVSNFVTPAAAKAALAAHPAPPAMAGSHAVPGARTMPPLVATSVSMNRGFAQVHVTFLSLALLLFGLAVRSSSMLLGWLGVAVGLFPLLWQLSGQFSPNPHTMPLVIFPQAAWMIAVGIVMIRARRTA